jgi:hypothetical protein
MGCGSDESIYWIFTSRNYNLLQHSNNYCNYNIQNKVFNVFLHCSFLGCRSQQWLCLYKDFTIRFLATDS